MTPTKGNEHLEARKRIGFWQYKNNDPRCTYPFEPDALGYCWGWVNFIDGNSKKPSCKNCELWNAELEKTNE